MRRKILTTITLGAVAGLLLLFALPSYNQGEPSIAGTEEKPFAFELDGKQMHISDLRGKVVVLNFWASWCPPCVDETPSLIALQSEIAPKGGMVLGISVDQDAQPYQQFLQAHGINFPTYRDPTQKIASEYGSSVWPETYIIGRDGRIARKLIGAQDWTGPEMTRYFNSLLAQN